MKKAQIKCKDNEFIKTILPLLKGKVFHITNAEGYKSICKDYAIKGNQAGTYPFSFSQSKNSYGRKRNYVCLIDLRDYNDRNIDDLLHKYGLNPHDSENPHFLILSPNVYDKLILWEQAQKEAGFNEMYIPYIECWYPDEVNLSLISEAIEVEIELCPPKYDGTFTSLVACAHWNGKHKK
jgi:hypothetical protein